MRAILWLVVFWFFSADTLLACDAAERKEQRALQDEYRGLIKDVKRVTSRLEGQQRRAEQFDAADLTDIGPVPPEPDVEISGFDEKGRFELDCEQKEEVGATLEAARASLKTLADEVAEYTSASEVREQRLVEIEERSDESSPDEGSLDGDSKAPPPTVAGEPDPPSSSNEPEADDSSKPAATPEHPAPMLVEGNEQVYQRVLTLPNASFHDSAGGTPNEDGQTAPFTVLYVFERVERSDKEWVRVGRKFAGEPEGWLPASQTLGWNSALVTQFAPVGKRERVLFFEDSSDLADIVSSPFFAEDAKALYKKLEGRQLGDESNLVAAEPATAVDYAAEPYLLPITAHIEQQFDNGMRTALLKVASISLKTSDLRRRAPESLEPEAPSGNLEEFRIGIAFVMDTTASMGPYIKRTYETIKTFYNAFEGAADLKASFGFVGYRDNLSHDPRVEYVTRIIQPLDIDVSPRSVIANIGSVRTAKAATVDWREDAFSGITTAIDDFDWEPFDLRLVLLITDAGPRDGGDPLASSGVTAKELAESARQKNMAIIPIHLRTPESERAGDVAYARSQYAVLGGQTGDINSMKYLSIDATSDEEFQREIGAAASQLVTDIKLAAQNKKAEGASEDAETPAVNDGYLTSDGKGSGRLAKLISNEILRAQLEYLGHSDDAAAPSFISGWASDRDLKDPRRQSLEVSVFLTRNQLSALAQSVEKITDAFKAAGSSPGAFFDQLQLIAATAARDPERVRADESAAIREILPAFLQGLPYTTDSGVLSLTREYWESISTADRQAFVEDLEAKLRIYQALYDQTENWVDFGADDPALEAYPVRLKQLP